MFILIFAAGSPRIHHPHLLQCPLPVCGPVWITSDKCAAHRLPCPQVETSYSSEDQCQKNKQQLNTKQNCCGYMYPVRHKREISVLDLLDRF